MFPSMYILYGIGIDNLTGSLIIYWHPTTLITIITYSKDPGRGKYIMAKSIIKKQRRHPDKYLKQFFYLIYLKYIYNMKYKYKMNILANIK